MPDDLWDIYLTEFLLLLLLLLVCYSGMANLPSII